MNNKRPCFTLSLLCLTTMMASPVLGAQAQNSTPSASEERATTILKNMSEYLAKASGLEVRVRLGEVSPDTKVIVMTGREIPAIRAAALESGVFAFLVKPFDDAEFLSLVHQPLRAAA